MPSFTDQASQLALAAEVCVNGNRGEEKAEEVEEQQQRKERCSSLEMQENQTELRHPVMSEGKHSQPATLPAHFHANKQNAPRPPRLRGSSVALPTTPSPHHAVLNACKKILYSVNFVRVSPLHMQQFWTIKCPRIQANDWNNRNLIGY